MRSWTGLGLLGVAAVLASGCTPTSSSKESPAAIERPLTLDNPLQHALKSGEIHEYRLSLQPDQVVDALVKQQGIDLSVRLVGPDRTTRLRVDSPSGDKGDEHLFAVTQEHGTYTLRIEGATWSKDSGSYVLQVREPRSAEVEDRIRAEAKIETIRCMEGRKQEAKDEKRDGIEHCRAALRLWQDLGDTTQQISVLHEWGRLYSELGETKHALSHYQKALTLATDVEQRVLSLNRLAMLYAEQANFEKAIKTGQASLKLAPGTGNPHLHAAALNNLGSIYRNQGNTDEALAHFARALPKWQEGDLNPDETWTLRNLGELYLAIGNPGLALEYLRETREAQKRYGEEDEEVWRLLGILFEQAGSPKVGLLCLTKALRLAQTQGDQGTEALILSDLGSSYLDLGDLASARASFEEARQIADRTQHMMVKAYALAGLGQVLEREGDATRSLELFAQSEKIYRDSDDLTALIPVLTGRARAEWALGRTKAALTSIDQAMMLVEQLREGATPRDLRLYVIAARTDVYDLKADLLLQLHEAEPAKGYAADAFKATEQRRARSLLEIVQGATKRPLPDNPKDLDMQKRGLTATEESRQRKPAAALSAPKPLKVREVQGLLDADTALIAYKLGEERSILWWIERGDFEVYRLPGRAELETTAGRVYGLMSQRPQRARREEEKRLLARLGSQLFGDAAERLGRVRRMAVVADGALQAIPFAALTMPGDPPQLLGETHALVQLPSASILAALRSRQASRSVPQDVIAVFAHPEFGDSTALPPLKYSLEEANAILDMVPVEKGRRFVGLDASRSTVLQTDLARFRFIHFATHGLVNMKHPDLSGIQLSRSDAQGRPAEEKGMLRVSEIYGLDLQADLVTLSACKTAFGPPVPGEGPLAISRSFLYAGASRVVGALWDVDDEATAYLMTRFYEGVLRDGKPASEALRDAQRAMRAVKDEDKDWNSPYYWAGFVLQGDWR